MKVLLMAASGIRTQQGGRPTSESSLVAFVCFAFSVKSNEPIVELSNMTDHQTVSQSCILLVDFMAAEGDICP
jgi:hypothetical protein